MSRKRKHHRKTKIERKQSRKVIKTILSLLITILVAAAATLTFRIGEAQWSTWLVTHRIQIITFLVLAIIISGLSIPIIAYIEKDFRPLSGSDVDAKWLDAGNHH